ncbi:phage minor head protein [Pseudomonas sp.]|uniref:phage minor head protein n=1 Tax=Pseudomonas sp. TaxID=306 RepID=UPI003FD85E05
MPTVNEILLNESIHHAVSLDQYKLSVVRRIIALLNQSDSSLTDALAKALERLPAESFTVERLEALLAEVRAINAQAYAQVAQELQADLKELSGYETNWQQTLFERAIPEPVLVRFPIASVSAEQAYAAAMSRPFQGSLLKDWAAKVEADRMVNVRNAIRTGYLEGKTTDQIVRSIRGTRAAGYADGFLERPRKDLAAVVRTAVSHTAATARQEFSKANEEILKAERWVSTLDNKTSEPCRIRDQLQYTVDTHKPIGHKIPWLQGPGKIHWNCRSTSSPVTKSWRELGIPIDEMTPGQRASMDGQVPADTTYSDWLGRQSDARKVEVLGPMRYQLYKDGKHTLEDFYSPTGEWLTLAQIAERDAQTFAKMAA